MKIRSRVKGMKALQAAMKRKERDLEAAADSAEKEAADDLRDDMKSRAPVDTGDLRDGIRAEKTPKGYAVGPDSEDEDKALAQEYGTRYMNAQPYAVPAEEDARREFPETVKEHVRKAAR